MSFFLKSLLNIEHVFVTVSTTNTRSSLLDFVQTIMFTELFAVSFICVIVSGCSEKPTPTCQSK